MTSLHQNPTHSSDFDSEDEIFAKQVLNRVLSHFHNKYQINTESVRVEIYNDLFRSSN